MRYLAFLAVLTLAASLVACGSDGSVSPGQDNTQGNQDNTQDNIDHTNFDPYVKTGLYLNILPPGQSPTPMRNKYNNFTDQSKMYKALTYADKGLQTSELVSTYFKSEAFNSLDSFRQSNITTVSSGMHSAQIARNPEHGVPHIYSDTRDGAMFGIGYATARDRLFLLDVLRHKGRGRMTDFLGLNPLVGFDRMLSSDLSSARKAGYSESELLIQVVNAIDLAANSLGPSGKKAAKQTLEDVRNFVDGINAYIKKIKKGKVPTPSVYNIFDLKKFTIRDVVAVTTLVNARFAAGGGAEMANAQLLNGITEEFPDYSDKQVCQLWHDLFHTTDPARPVTTTKVFKTQSPAVIDSEACPLKSSFSAKFPGAVLPAPNSFQYGGTTLAVTQCAKPKANSGAGLPTCPNYGQSVVDNTVTLDSNTTVAGLLQWDQLAKLKDALSSSTMDASRVQVPLRRNAAATVVTHARKRVRTMLAKLHKAFDSGLTRVMSNALLINGQNTQSGHPIAVFGPQTGYFVPEILFEFEVHGGGLNAAGVAFPGLPYVVLGRGADFAFSATSATADIVDIRVLKLCNPSNATVDGYIYNGQCEPFYKRVDKWTAESLLGTDTPKMVTRTILRAPAYGPVIGFATVNGQRVAIARQRSTYFGEVDSAIGFMKINENQIHDPESFMDTFYLTTGTFNWFYVDSQNTAFYMAGLLPVRAEGEIYPLLPQWGTGQYDWKQTGTGRPNPEYSFDNFLPQQAHPHVVNPKRGWMTSWNNAQAPGFWAADSKMSWGSVQRVQALNKRIKAELATGPITPGELVQVMADGGFTDLIGQEVLPVALDIIATADNLTTDQQKAVDLLKSWMNGGDYPSLGAWRRDRNKDGEYDARAAVVLMDAWYQTMINQTLKQIVQVEDVLPMGRSNEPGPNGSAYNGGYYSYLQRVFMMALGKAEYPYDSLQCADGTLAGCRQALLTSLDNALQQLGGIANSDNWDGTTLYDETVEAQDNIEFRALGLNSVPDIPWVNRPTFQQVVQPTRQRALR